MDDLVSDFVLEAADSLGGLQSALAALSLGREGVESTTSMLSRMHGLKGLCGFVGFARAEAVAHAAESLLQAVEASGRAPSWRALSMLADALERISGLIGAASKGQGEPAGDDHELITGLELTAAALRGDACLIVHPLPVATVQAVADVGPDRRARAPWVGLDGLVRGLGDRLGKRIDLMVGGDDLRIAPEASSSLRTALIALVRNACDHGVEAPEERRAAGKPGRARLQLFVRRTQDGVAIDLTDDGRGVDPALVRQRARVQGVVAPETLAAMSDTEVQALVFMAGVTTARQLTAISGRGLGLELVRREVENLGGQVEMSSTPGQGARFTLSLPACVLAQPSQRRLAAA